MKDIVSHRGSMVEVVHGYSAGHFWAFQCCEEIRLASPFRMVIVGNYFLPLLENCPREIAFFHSAILSVVRISL